MANVIDGRKTVATAGTRVQLGPSQGVEVVTISAETDNTGVVVVGGPTVVAALATRQGIPLSATSPPLSLLVDDLADIWLDSTVNTDGVTYTAISEA